MLGLIPRVYTNRNRCFCKYQRDSFLWEGFAWASPGWNTPKNKPSLGPFAAELRDSFTLESIETQPGCRQNAGGRGVLGWGERNPWSAMGSALGDC